MLWWKRSVAVASLSGAMYNVVGPRNCPVPPFFCYCYCSRVHIHKIYTAHVYQIHSYYWSIYMQIEEVAQHWWVPFMQIEEVAQHWWVPGLTESYWTVSSFELLLEAMPWLHCAMPFIHTLYLDSTCWTLYLDGIVVRGERQYSHVQWLWSCGQSCTVVVVRGERQYSHAQAVCVQRGARAHM
jgi:hypothetical protein